jgi:hypothetical protein
VQERPPGGDHEVGFNRARPPADTKRVMAVLTCFYCSAPASEEVVAHLGGEHVLLRLCRRHAGAERKRAAAEKPPGAPGAVSGSPRPRNRLVKNLKSRLEPGD